jgi:hypothetical protein
MDELDSLLVDPMELDRALLARGLAGYVGFTADGTPYPLERWAELSEGGKVIATLLALRAATAAGRRSDAAITPSALAQTSGIAPGTAKRELRGLAEKRIASVDSGHYTIAGPMLRRALDEMSGARARRNTRG